MSLKSYFPEQFDNIKEFMVSGTEIIRCVRIDPEMKPMFTKALIKMEEDTKFPHAFLMVSDKFDTPAGFFDTLLAVLTRSLEENKAALSAQGIKCKAPDMDLEALKAPDKFIRYASRFIESLPDHMGALIFVIDPEEIADQAGYKESILFLAAQTQSDWLKFLVLDSRVEPLLIDIELECNTIGLQTFYLSPDEIEKRVNEDLSTPDALSPIERRQYKGLLAGFAFARKEYDKAVQLQKSWVAEAQAEGEPAEAANAWFNLGNTYLAGKAHDLAAEAFSNACNISIEHKLDALSPFAFTNLGIALHRLEDLEQACASLAVARDMFNAQNQRPGEAYALDCLAQIHALDGRRDEAEKTWQNALSIYEGLTSSTFKDLREQGVADITAKLNQLGTNTQSDNRRRFFKFI